MTSTRTGLWKQVASQGRDLLASQMRLEIESAGKTYTAAGNHVALTEKAADRVQGNGSWTAGPIEGRTEFVFDYDGMEKFILHFGAAGQQLDAMRLVIPLRTGEASLMHAVTDLLRFHYAGRIPNGDGVRSDSAGTRHEGSSPENGLPARRRKGLGLAPRRPLAVARSLRAVYLAGWSGAGDRLVRRERPRLEPGRRSACAGDPSPRGGHLAGGSHDRAKYVVFAPSNRDVRPHGHARQADARTTREFPPLVDGTAEREDQEHRRLRLHGGVLLLGRGRPLLRLSSRAGELQHL